MESLTGISTEIKTIGEKKRHIKINENVIGPSIQNFVAGMSISLFIICVRLLNNTSITSFSDIKTEIIIGFMAFAAINILRFLVLDEGLLLAYKIGWITANTKNNVANAIGDLSTTNTIDTKIIDCAKLIIKQYFTNQPFDTTTLLNMNYTRTTIDKARGLLIKANIIVIDHKKPKFLQSDYKTSIAKLKKCVESL